MSGAAVFVYEGDLMFGLGLASHDLACGIGGNGTEASDLTGLTSAVECRHRNVDVDQAAATS